jgi:hypothetical protein
MVPHGVQFFSREASGVSGLLRPPDNTPQWPLSAGSNSPDVDIVDADAGSVLVLRPLESVTR